MLGQRIAQITVSVLLGLFLGAEIVVILMLPGWVQPEGLAAAAIWGRNALIGLVDEALPPLLEGCLDERKHASQLAAALLPQR